MLHPVDIIVLLECLFSFILRLENISSSATESLISSILRLETSVRVQQSLRVLASVRVDVCIRVKDISLFSFLSSRDSTAVFLLLPLRVSQRLFEWTPAVEWKNSSLHSSVFEGVVCSCPSASLHSASNATTRQSSQEALHFPSSRMLILLSFQPLVDSINVLALQL